MGMFSGIIRRSNSNQVKKQEILHPMDRDELMKIISNEMKKQGYEYVDLTHIDVSRITNMKRLFTGWIHLKSLNVSNWDVSNVKHMEGMFQYCESLEELDLTSWVVKKVETTLYMFYDCNIKYEKIDDKLVQVH